MKLLEIYSAAIKQSDDLAELAKTPCGLPYRELLLRCSLVFAMSAIDRLLHEAISRKFSILAKNGALDNFVEVSLSASYRIAQEARKRKGKGGKIKSRPGNQLKEEFLRNIFTNTYLNSDKLQKITSACGHPRIFTLFGNSLRKNKTHAEVVQRWKHIYTRRNHIAHECDIARMARTRKIKFNVFDPKKTRSDIRFVRSFGTFLAKTID